MDPVLVHQVTPRLCAQLVIRVVPVPKLGPSKLAVPVVPRPAKMVDLVQWLPRAEMIAYTPSSAMHYLSRSSVTFIFFVVEPPRLAGKLHRPRGHDQFPALVAHPLLLRPDVQVRRWGLPFFRLPRFCNRPRRVGSLVQAGLGVLPIAGMPRHVRRVKAGVFGRRSRLQGLRPFGYPQRWPWCCLRLRPRRRRRICPHWRQICRWWVVEGCRTSQRLCLRP